MKRILFALSLLATPLHAQYLQNESTSDYSLRTTLTKESDVSYLWSVQFRNEQPFDAHRVYFITDVSLYGLSGISGLHDRTDQQVGNFPSGHVFTGTINPPLPGYNAFAYNPDCFSGGSPSTFTLRVGCSDTSTSIMGGLGLIGCAVPLLPLGSSPENYAGSTCSSAGFDGWQTIQTRVTYFAPTPDADLSFLNASVYGFALERDAFNIVPEPSTWAMMGAGLVVLGMVRRKRGG